MKSRREFLAGSAWMGVAAAAAGCVGNPLKLGGGAPTKGAPMQGYFDKPMPLLRVGMIGLGVRGMPALRRVAMIPGCRITEVCDYFADRADEGAKWLVDRGLPAPRRRCGEDGWRGVCDSPDVDVVYCAAHWPLHLPVCVRGMAAGKHVLTETPGVRDSDEAWELVEAAERCRRHCYLLENCCYGEDELLAFSLCAKGLLGEILHAECGYCHDQREVTWGPRYRKREGDALNWKIAATKDHLGNMYPTHGFGPVARCMNINHGDKIDFLVSMETKQCTWERYAAVKYPEKARLAGRLQRGDVNTSLIRTALGRTIYLVYDVATPQPYSRLNILHGSRGIFRGYPEPKFGWGARDEDFVHEFFGAEEAERLRREHMHPVWKAAGELGRKVGGHGGMDFVMDLRWAYCLQNGLPLDTDVYDLATWSSLRDTTEKSVRTGSSPVEFPDFTRGGWKTAKPFEVGEMDIAKFGKISVSTDEDALKANKAEGISH